jgi:molybdopterin converting factor small subunit
MKILVKLHGPFQKYLPPGSEGYSCQVEARTDEPLSDVLLRLGIPQDEEVTIVRNHRRGHKADAVGDGDVVALFPPVSGGG